MIIQFPLLQAGTRFKSIATGDGGYDLGIKTDGTVLAWAAPSSSITDVPTGLSNVVAIAAVAYHTLALKSDGTVVAWGAGAPDDPDDPFDTPQSTLPAGLCGVIAIAAEGWSRLALVAPPTVAPPQFLPGGSTEVIVTGTVGIHYTVQASTNVADWTPIASFVASKADTATVDPGATNAGQRFYRALLP